MGQRVFRRNTDKIRLRTGAKHGYGFLHDRGRTWFCGGVVDDYILPGIFVAIDVFSGLAALAICEGLWFRISRNSVFSLFSQYRDDDWFDAHYGDSITFLQLRRVLFMVLHYFTFYLFKVRLSPV